MTKASKKKVATSVEDKAAEKKLIYVSIGVTLIVMFLFYLMFKNVF